MECYVCGFPRPEGAKYCPGCGRYCADDPNVKNTPITPTEELILDEYLPESPVAEEVIPVQESVPEDVPVPMLSEGPEQPVQEPEPDAPAVSVRKRKHRPVLIPVLIMAMLFTIGTTCWFLIPRQTPGADIPTETTEPGVNKDYKIPLPSHKGNKPNSTKPSLPSDYEPTDDRCFRIENGIVSFIPERYDGSPILVIPSEINGQTVTGIAPGGFSELEDVTTLILPDTLETIGAFAFSNCKKLRGVYIPDSVTSIDSGAFAGCLDMESVSIPVGTTSIGADAFDDCASLMYIFYEGTFEEWEALYDEYITPFTFAICTDGEYYHGTVTP